MKKYGSIFLKLVGLFILFCFFNFFYDHPMKVIDAWKELTILSFGIFIFGFVCYKAWKI